MATPLVTPQDLQRVLEILSTAQVPLGVGYNMRAPLEALAHLAAQPHPIGAIAPSGPAPADHWESKVVPAEAFGKKAV